jgi:hypothetical protein
MKKHLFSLFFIFLSFISKSQNYNFSLGGNVTSGNLSSYTLTVKTNLSSSEGKSYQFNFSPSVDYGKITNQQGKFELRKREFYSILNYEKQNGIFKFYIFSETENSYLRKIKLRGSIGTGISISIIKTDAQKLDISQFILPEIFWSSFNNQKDNLAFRLSTRIRYNLIGEKFKFINQILIQPAVYTILNDGREISLKNNTNIRFNQSYDYSISKNLSIGISNDIIIQTYTSFINPKIKPFDSNLNLYFKASI